MGAPPLLKTAGFVKSVDLAAEEFEKEVIPITVVKIS